MIEVIKVIISSMILNLSFIKIGEILLEEKTKLEKWKIVIICALNAILISTNHLIINNFTKFIFCLLDFIFLAKIIYGKELGKCIIISTLYYITSLIAEMITILIFAIMYKLFSLGDLESAKNAILLTLIMAIISILIVKIMQKPYRGILEKIKNNNTIIFGIMAILILSCIGSLFYRIELSGWVLNTTYILDTIITIATGIIGIMLIKQRVNYERIENQYKDLAKYSEINATLLEEYSMLNHEHKNQLIIIKGMVEDKNKELENYVQSLLYKKENIKFKWIRELNNISFQGLKSFMNHKILEMKSEKLEVYVSVSKQCKKYKLEKMSTSDKDKIYSIIGVFLDNAKDAAKESKEKKVIINAYMEEKEMYIEIANTFKGKVDLDKINNYGYTSKGTGHGTGLYMIKNLIKDSVRFKTITRIDQEYFIQTLIIQI